MSRSESCDHDSVSQVPCGIDIRTFSRVELAYARVSTSKQDLERQLDALGKQGIPPADVRRQEVRATTDRPGLRALLDYARGGDVIVVHTLDRLGRTVRDTLNLIHELSERGVGVRNLADPIRIDSTDPGGPMAQLAVVLLALFAQMGTHLRHRACRARPRGGHGQEPPHRAADQRGRGQVGLGGAPARLRRGPVGDPGGTRAARGTLPEPGNSPPAPPAFGLGAAAAWCQRPRQALHDYVYADVPAETGVRLGAGRAAPLLITWRRSALDSPYSSIKVRCASPSQPCGRGAV